MLQRAANNAYSWWWASHIRTTQSKWLETTVGGKQPHLVTCHPPVGIGTSTIA